MKKTKTNRGFNYISQKQENCRDLYSRPNSMHLSRTP